MAAFYNKAANYTGVILAASTTDFYSCGEGSLSNITTEAPAKTIFRNAGVYSFLGIRVDNNTLSGSATLTLRKNGADGNEKITIGAGLTGYFEDSVNTDSISAGDTVNYQIVTGTGTSITFRSIGGVFSAAVGTILHYHSGATQNFTGAANTTYPVIAGDITNQVTEAWSQIKAKESFTLRDLYVYVNSNNRTTTSTVTSRKNASPGNLTISIPAAATGVFEDTTHSDSLISGDLFNLAVTIGSGGGTLAIQRISAEGFNSVSPTLQFVTGGGPVSMNSAVTRFYPIQGSNSPTGTERAAKTNTTALLSNMAIYVNANSLNGSATLHLRKNGVNGQQQIVIPTTATGYFEDTVDTDVLLPPDMIGYSIVTSGSSGNLNFTTIAMVSQPFVPTIHPLPILGCGQ